MRLPATLRRLLDIRAGERDVVLRAGLAMGLLVAGHTMLETARDALFLQRLAASRLTLVYGLIAALSLVVSPIGAALARRFGRRNGLVAGVLVAAYGTALFHQVRLGSSALIALYTWSGLVGTLLLLQFWLFAAEVFTVAQGKRLFGLIAAGGALGAAASSVLAVALVSAFSVRSLLLVSAVLFVAAGVVLTAIRVEQEAPAAARVMDAAGVSRRALRAVLSDRYVLRLAALSVCGSAALLVLDYVFKATAAQAFAPARLGAFFALYYAGMNAASLLMQLFASSALIRRLGVVPALSLLPALLLVVGGAALLAGHPLVLVLLLKGGDGALRYSTYRVAVELVQMPLSPALHDRAKSFIDGPLQRASQALTAGLLLWLASHALPGRPIGLLLLVLCAGWFLVTAGLRKPYLQRFREALARPTADTHLLVDELDVDAIEAVLEALSSRDPDRVIGAMELLADKQRVRLIPALVLYHEDESVLASALSILAASDRDDWLEYAERLLGHPAEKVRLAALRALSLRGRHAALERALGDPSAAVRAHASFWLVTHNALPDPRANHEISALLAGEGEDASTGLRALLSAVRDAPDSRWIPVLLAAGTSPDERVFEQAALAMATVPDVRFIPLLIPRLAMQDGRAAVRGALIPLGDAALGALHEALEDDATQARVRAQLPRAIADFRSQRAADIMVGQLEHPGYSGLLRYKILRGLLRLSSEHGVQIPHVPIEQQIKQNLLEFLRMLGLQHAVLQPDGAPRAARSRRLLLGLLDAKREQALERVFHLLQIRHRGENIRRVYYALRQPDRRTRAYAMEFLETLGLARGKGELSEQVRDLLRIVVDELPAAERLRRAAYALPPQPSDHAQALRTLMGDADEYLAAVAAYHALELGSVELEREVVRAVRERPALNRIDEATALFPMPHLGRT